MAHDNPTNANAATSTNADLRPLRDMNDFEVADGYPDLRGWEVKTPDGQKLGKVHDLIVSVSEMRVRYLDVDVDDSVRSAGGTSGAGAAEGHALVPIGTADLDDANDDVIVRSLAGGDVAGYPRYSRSAGITSEYESSLRGRLGGGAAAAATGAAAAGAAAAGSSHYDHEHYDESRLYGKARGRGAARTGASAAQDEQRLTLSEEELRVGKQQRQAGEVTLHKTVETEHVREQVPVTHEEVSIERRPLSADANVQIGGGESEIRVPLMREEAVAEKRAVVKEQIIVRKQAITENQTVEADLRRERLDVDRSAETTRSGSSTTGTAGGAMGAAGIGRTDAGMSGAQDRATNTGPLDRLADKADDLKDRVDGNPASKPGPDRTDKRI